MNNIANYIFEISSLKRVIRSSYQNLGLGGESVAEHSFIVAVIGHTLASLEKVDENKVIKMCLYHDIAETRTGDSNFIHKRYQIRMDKEAVLDITMKLPNRQKHSILKVLSEFERGLTKESVVARDADRLEQLFQEKFYADQGSLEANEWIKYSIKRLTLPSSKKIGRAVIKSGFSDWWHSLGGKPALKR